MTNPDDSASAIHLRLPPQFQSAGKKECYCKEIEMARGLAASLCLNWDMPECRAHDKPKPSADAVEEKIIEILKISCGGDEWLRLEKQLKDLVSLARGGK